MSDAFYADLPAHDQFDDIAEPSAYTPVPADWHVIITDVEGSTAAVQDGRYRAVNYAGAASIAAVLNAAGTTAVPFVFGGDGATFLIPSSLRATIEPVLRAVQAVAHDELDLTLRAGIVPVATLYEQGARLAVLRHVVSENYDQAMFTGGGLIVAERLVKDPATADLYSVGEGPSWDDPDRQLYNGLECRWEEIPSTQGEIVTLLVMARPDGEDQRLEVYKRVLRQVEATFGGADAVHPVRVEAMRLSRSRKRLGLEASIRAPKGEQAAYQWTTWLLNLLGIVLIKLGLKTQDTDWAEYPHKFRGATDYRKFDDTLRMVLSGSSAQREALTAWLDQQHQDGHLVYGTHVSDRATVTCLVFNRMGKQVHFVDGADGGYTAAARVLKKQLAA